MSLDNPHLLEKRTTVGGEMVGVTLRDLFAGLCAAGLCASPHTTGALDAVARDAYNAADFLLAERNKELGE